MTNDEIDRAIAEYFGADCMTGSRFATWPMQAGEMLRKITVHVAQSDERDGRLFAQIPNFSTDLNAMHEAEKALTDEQHRLFRSYLGEVVGDVAYFCRKIVSSEAHQRAEALVRTIGKWRDE